MAATELNEVFPSHEVAACPFPFYERLRTEAPVYKVPGRDEYLVSRHADIAYALREAKIFSTALVEAPGLDYEGGRPILHFDPPEHTAKRLLAAPLFMPRRLPAYEPIIQQHVDDLMETFIDRGEVDFAEEFAYLLPTRVICSLLDLPLDGPEYEAIRQWSRVDRSNTRYFTGALEGKKAETERIMGNMLEYIAGIVRERAESPGDDMISELIQAQVEADGEAHLGFTTTVAAELLAGGVSTTANMMGSAMVLLTQHPEQFAQVLDDHKLIPWLLEETLRLEAPVQWRARITTEDVELSGVEIPKGSRVLLLFASGSRDEDAFEDAPAFCPTRSHRELKRHFGFGYGEHFCLGAPLARLEATIALQTFFTRTTNIRNVPEKSDFATIEHLHFRAPRKVWLSFDNA
jgi:cytochrome P450